MVEIKHWLIFNMVMELEEPFFYGLVKVLGFLENVFSARIADLQQIHVVEYKS